jgi:hypothetical protein
MSYYAGWAASIDGEKDSQLRIFQAGPNMMMVFPEKEGGFSVRFVFEKAADVQTGEAISLVSAAAILVLVVFGFVRRAWVIPEGWAKTHHTGSGLGELER